MSELVKRQETWSKFAVALHEAESNLSISANQIEQMVNSFQISKDNLKEAEEKQTEIKAMIKEIVQLRKSKTDPMDRVKAKLMEFEKSAKDSLSQFENNLLHVKKAIQKELDAKRFKEEEKAEFISKINNAKINYKAECERIVERSANDLYLKMLDDEIDYIKYDQHVKENSDVQVPLFAEFMKRENFQPQHLTKGEAGIIYTNNKQEDVNYRDNFISLMAEKKTGYRSELANKEEAKKRMEAERKAKEEARAQQLEMEKLQAKMDAQSKVQEKADFKELKKTYEVDMEENEENAIKLFASWSANFAQVNKHLRVSKWFKITPDQIAKALSKMKTKDNSLEFSGINFKEVEKL